MIEGKPESKDYVELDIEMGQEEKFKYVILYVKNGEFKEIVEKHVKKAEGFIGFFNNLKL